MVDQLEHGHSGLVAGDDAQEGLEHLAQGLYQHLGLVAD